MKRYIISTLLYLCSALRETTNGKHKICAETWLDRSLQKRSQALNGNFHCCRSGTIYSGSNFFRKFGIQTGPYRIGPQYPLIIFNAHGDVNNVLDDCDVLIGLNICDVNNDLNDCNGLMTMMSKTFKQCPEAEWTSELYELFRIILCMCIVMKMYFISPWTSDLRHINLQL